VSHEFLFALHLSDDGRPGRIAEIGGMLSDLARSVLLHAGYAEAVIAEVGEALRVGLAHARITGDCDVQFRAHAGELEILVLQGGRRVFQTSRRLPD
jgi:hypothetical protein